MKVRADSKPISPEEALTRLQRFCAFRERSVREVSDKMHQWGITRSQSETIIGRLSEQGFLNEQRYSVAFAGGKFRTRKWGRVKIKAMLAGARVSESSIQKAIDQIPESEYRTELERLMVKKLAQIREPDAFVRKQKLARYAMGKGFESELVWELASRMVPDP